MADYNDIGLNSRLQKVTSLAAKPSLTKQGYDVGVSIERGAIKSTNTGQLYDLSSAGTVSAVVLGAAGSGTETLVVTSTLSSKLNKKLIATHDMSFYQGTASVGTARVFNSTSAIPYADYIIMHWQDWGESTQVNVVAKDIIRNTRGATTTIMCVNQWRYIIPQGGA